MKWKHQYVLHRFIADAGRYKFVVERHGRNWIWVASVTDTVAHSPKPLPTAIAAMAAAEAWYEQQREDEE